MNIVNDTMNTIANTSEDNVEITTTSVKKMTQTACTSINNTDVDSDSTIIDGAQMASKIGEQDMVPTLLETLEAGDRSGPSEHFNSTGIGNCESFPLLVSSGVSDDFSDDESLSDDEEEKCSNVKNRENVPSMTTSNFQKQITNKETQDVRVYKVIIFAVLAITTVGMVAFVSVFVRNRETSRFQAAFYENAQKIFAAVGNSIDNTLVPLDSLAVTLVSYARSRNDTWPFVTLPDFGLRVAKLLPLSDGMVLTFSPIVQPKDRIKWELYSSFNNHWVNESISIQEEWDGYYGPISYDWEPYNVIYGDDGDIPLNVSRLMAPQWQNFPVSTQYYDPYNWDWLSQEDTQALQATMYSQSCVLQAPYMIARPGDLVAQAESEGWIDFFSDYIKPNEEPFEPVFDIAYPIIDDLSQVDLQNSKENGTVVGFLTVTAYFREIVRNVLPPGSDSMVIVVNNTCSETFTYQIDGSNLIYLGIEDQHDKKYDSLVVSSLITTLSNFQQEESIYSGVPLNKEFCPYSLSVFPTTTMEKSYRSGKAAVYAVLTLLSFVALAMLFRCYNSKVETRQTQVLSVAVKSSEIVSSLFPTTVHDQLYHATTQNEKRKTDDKVLGDYEQSDDESPIAKSYPDTTVMFADIKGFTAWSSTREPSHVFLLLESIYGAFDAIADKYGVFKVETIGDTYVAVAGLPTPKKYHAVIMAKFAKRCILKMAEVTKKLEGKLGKDTSTLTIRVGLNSGPTTAGVLRGTKARFQLFGDTVNTAARMESNGESSKIHVSESTARTLEHFGKGHWLTLRDEAVSVKGKGLMQTYWCNPSTQRHSASGESYVSSGNLSSNGSIGSA